MPPQPYQPTYTEYRLVTGKDRRGKPVYGAKVARGTPGAVKVKRTSPTWWGKWKKGGRWLIRPQPLSADLGTARTMLAEKVRAVELGTVGIREDRTAERTRPLAEHLADFVRHLQAKRDLPRYVAEVEGHVEAVLEGCRFATPADLDPDAVLDFLAGLREGAGAPALTRESYTAKEAAGLAGVRLDSVWAAFRRGSLPGRRVQPERGHARLEVGAGDLAAWLASRPGARGASIETSNHYLRSIKSFSRWLKKRVGDDPLEHLQALNADVDRRRVRRAMSQGQVPELLAAVAGEVAGLDAVSRRLLYHAALRTGLRAGELASLTPASFDLGPRPSVTLQAAYSKHRRQDTLPLRADLAAELRAFCAGKEPATPLWPGGWAENPAAVLRVDLEAAGIPYRDGQGRVLDFHGLRHTFITHLVESGVPPKTAQLLARHSTITLTMDRYSHVSVMDAAAELEKLPGVGPPPGGKAAGAG